MKKISTTLLTLFAYGIVSCLFAGGLSLVGYLIALLIGGEIATNLCAWVFKTYLPWVIRLSAVFSGFGLLGMYTGKKQALTAAPVSDK